MQNNFEAPVWLLKKVFECSIAWCDLRLGRAIVHGQRNHLRKPKFSRNRDFLVLHCLFLVPLGALGGAVFLEVSDNPHLSPNLIFDRQRTPFVPGRGSTGLRLSEFTQTSEFFSFQCQTFTDISEFFVGRSI